MVVLASNNIAVVLVVVKMLVVVFVETFVVFLDLVVVQEILVVEDENVSMDQGEREAVVLVLVVETMEEKIVVGLIFDINEEEIVVVVSEVAVDGISVVFELVPFWLKFPVLVEIEMPFFA